MENYYDPNKLSLNVFDDFEKQTSWQSYTTSLITDIIQNKNFGETPGQTKRSGLGAKTMPKNGMAPTMKK